MAPRLGPGQCHLQSGWAWVERPGSLPGRRLPAKPWFCQAGEPPVPAASSRAGSGRKPSLARRLAKPDQKKSGAEKPGRGRPSPGPTPARPFLSAARPGPRAGALGGRRRLGRFDKRRAVRRARRPGKAPRRPFLGFLPGAAARPAGREPSEEGWAGAGPEGAGGARSWRSSKAEEPDGEQVKRPWRPGGGIPAKGAPATYPAQPQPPFLAQPYGMQPQPAPAMPPVPLQTVYIPGPLIFLEHPMQICCPACNQMIVTRISYQPGALAWLSCGGLALLG
ncbi:lipopolysaccharide-induced tumor necrosis factor-alpha factor isoform X1 [Notechis scutatus]|nr:lipopolysaccharide-induced tumor necrosis factor-alpha factor isoform X1 [Notechis scutatus]